MKTLLITLVFMTVNSYASRMKLDGFLFKSKIKTDSIIIYANNKVILEKYGKNYNKDSKHIMWSVSKSFTSALVGIAVGEKRLNIDQSICDFYPQFLNTEKCKIKIDHLLRYTAGLKWNEVYEPASIIDSLSMDKSDVLQMSYGSGANDTALYTLNKPLIYQPGSTVQYNTGTPNVLMGVLKKLYGQQYENWVNDSLFTKINSTNYKWMKDQTGSFLGGSHLYTTPQTMLNFGLMYLNEGKFNNEQVLSKEWITYTKTLTESQKIIDHQDLPGKDIIESTGAMWWLNTPIKGKIPWPDAPLDTVIAWGHWSQFIIVIPSKKVILVRTGLDKTNYFDINEFIKLSLNFVGGTHE
jgi:CubicO group peptidase (beta-lactamase class C family)